MQGWHIDEDKVMARVVAMPRERITQKQLQMLEVILEMGDRHLRMRLADEQEWLEKMRQGAAIEPGPLSLEMVEEREVVRRLKVVRKARQRQSLCLK